MREIWAHARATDGLLQGLLHSAWAKATASPYFFLAHEPRKAFPLVLGSRTSRSLDSDTPFVCDSEVRGGVWYDVMSEVHVGYTQSTRTR
jgi:hypothetical protein